MPFGIEVNRVGIQEIYTVDTRIKEDDSLEEKIKKIYKALKLDNRITDEQVQKWAEIVESIDYFENEKGQKTTRIVLKKEERERRLKELLEGMGELAKRIEGSERNLSPFFAAFSLDYIAPKYYLLMKHFLKEKLSEGGYLNTEELAQELINFANSEEKTIKTADFMNYNQVVNEIVEEIFKES